MMRWLALLGLILIGSADAQTITVYPAGIPPNLSQVLGSLRSANMNSTADQAIPIRAAITKFTVSTILVTNCTGTLTIAAGGIYPAASKGGTPLVAAAQAYSALTTSAIILPTTLAGTVATTAYTVSSLFLSLTTGAGSAAVCDFFVIGTDLT